MKRVYKEDTPNGTISKIRKILNDVLILPYEEKWFHPYNQIYSVRLQCVDKDGSFGTNGKGRNIHYALASAYAEFIERIQNGYIIGIYGINRFFLNKFKKKNGFIFFPDEKKMKKEQFKKLPKNYLNDLFGNIISEKEREKEIELFFNKIRKNGSTGVISVPFYDFRKEGITYLPLNLTLTLSGSNGMAAGNTSSEGIFQALCELIERYSATTVYYNRLTPPTISREYLENFPKELAIIADIEEKGYKVFVKDFSCGKSFPAIGVLIIDSENKKYRLNIGAETSFQIALSRALTEIYQGIGDKDAFDKIMLEIPLKEHSYFFDDSKEGFNKRSLEIRKFIINGEGVFPKSLFENDYSYNFNPEVFSLKETYKEEVQSLINIFLTQGFDVYIRDVSFLGFPSFYVYVPHISLFGRKTFSDSSNTKSLTDTVNQDQIEDVFFPTASLLNSKNRIKMFLNIVAPNGQNKFSGAKMKDLLRLDFNYDSYWFLLPLSYFLTIFFYIIGEYGNAIKYLQIFMEETDNKNDSYYKSIFNYFAYLEKGVSNEHILKNIPKEIIESFSSVDTIISDIDLPNCPNCDDCKLINDCKTTSNIKMAGRISKAMNKNQIDQNYLQEYLLDFK